MDQTLVTYAHEFDEVLLIQRRSQQHQVETFLNFEDQLVKPSVSKNVFYDLVFNQDSGKISDLQVNSMSSSFKEGVYDTGQFRAVSRFFKDF